MPIIKIFSKTSLVVLILRCVVAAVWIVFGGMKLADLHGFVENVGYFEIAPFHQAPWDMALAYFLPCFEVLVGLCLIMHVCYRGALLCSLGMLLVFSVAIASVWARGLNIECGCAGKEISLGGYPGHLTVLLLLIGVVVYLVIDEIFPADKECT